MIRAGTILPEFFSRWDWLCLSLRDPVGIQTQDLQNRNLTLYSAKLRDRCVIADAKVQKKVKRGTRKVKN